MISLIIFDMDGTLVDSEVCAAQALLDVLPEMEEKRGTIVQRYRGMKLQAIFNDIEHRHDIRVTDTTWDRYRQRELELGSTLIQINPGVESMLARLQKKYCIASNAPKYKTERSLSTCGLSRFFSTNIYSAYDVQAWKPDPALFLHAAKSEGVDRKQCVVIEDSDVGITAAIDAGMQPVFYNPMGRETIHRTVKSITQFDELMDLLPS